MDAEIRDCMEENWSARGKHLWGLSEASTPYMAVHMSKTEFLSLADPKALQYVLHTSGYHYPKGRETTQSIKLIVGKGIIWSHGP